MSLGCFGFFNEIAESLGLSDDIIDNLNELSGDYMISRYPDVSGMVPYEEYDREIAVEKINVAKFVFEKLKDRYRRIEVKHE